MSITWIRFDALAKIVRSANGTSSLFSYRKIQSHRHGIHVGRPLLPGPGASLSSYHAVVTHVQLLS